MPKEVEWEYACRGGGSFSKEHYGFDYYFDTPTNELSPQLANYLKSNLGRTTKVGSYPPNSLGIYDMHGNVREWGQDLIYLSPKNARRPRRTSRGGNWLEMTTGSAAGNRAYLPAMDMHGSYGLRIVLAPAEEDRAASHPAPVTATPVVAAVSEDK